MEALDELEDHLLTAAEELRSGFATDEEALLEAMRRLGEPDRIGADLASVEAREEPWLPARLVVGTGLFLASMALGLAAPQALASRDPLLTLHMLLFALGYLATCSLGMVCGLFVTLRCVREPALAQVRGVQAAIRRLATVAVLLLGAGLVTGLAHANGWGGGRFGVNAYLLGGTVVLLSDAAIVLVARRRGIGYLLESETRLGIGACLAATLGGFGAVLIEGQHTVPGGGAWMLGLLLIELALLAVAFRPGCVCAWSAPR